MYDTENFELGSSKNPHTDYDKFNKGQLSPMYQHYVEVKEQHPNTLLLYRVGDFFECFFQDAVTIAQELELVITSKEGGREIGRVAMTGVPHHALDRYTRLLVEKGYAVVICDQVEDSSEASAEKRLVERQVTRLLTPGTVTEQEMLNARCNNFLAAIVLSSPAWGLAYADISTGEFLTTTGSDLATLNNELMRLQPAEILLPTNAPDLKGLLRPGQKSSALPPELPDCFCYSLRSQAHFSLNQAKQRILDTFRLRSLEGLGCTNLPLAIRASGGLLEYIEDTQRANKVPVQPLKTYSLADYLVLDQQTRRNLEITQTVRDGTLQGSLLWSLDKTCTAMGGRALRRWLLQPLLDREKILTRQATIRELLEKTQLRQDLRQLLKQFYDLERLSGRVGAGTANAREVQSLADSLVRLKDIAKLAKNATSSHLTTLQNVPPELEEIGLKVISYLVESPPIQLKEGGVIKSGISTYLDDLRRLQEEDQKWLANLEVTERQRSGISTLKVGYNKTFGYYLTIPRSKAAQAPENYVRKQTLLNEERYITPELKERETRILTGKDDLNRLEYDLFTELRTEVAQKAQEIRLIACKVAEIDVLAALAEVALTQGYCCPEITTGRSIDIIEGRHPVVEKMLGTGFFVPNSTYLGGNSPEEDESDYPDLIVLTGPNASGKSCYLRQVGLIQLMCQMGSYVPARAAQLAICDRIFTRVGAVDDLTTGQSTFMVEMNETANILNHASDRSLVLLDEIGRGTATFDGLSIAWSVAEYLAKDIQCRTIFATHYHEMNELSSILSNIANYQVTVKELPNEIVFLHQVRPGGADRSYGIEAGRLAGLPSSVITRAKQVLAQIEKHSKIALGLRAGVNKVNPTRLKKDGTTEQLDIFT